MKHLSNLSKLPWKPIVNEGGYFVVCDISHCIDLIPAKYLASHDFAECDKIYKLNMPDGKVPRDLAFVRWMTVEHGIVLIPMSFFYKTGSPNTWDLNVRVSIAKFTPTIEKVVQLLIEKFG